MLGFCSGPLQVVLGRWSRLSGPDERPAFVDCPRRGSLVGADRQTFALLRNYRSLIAGCMFIYVYFPQVDGGILLAMNIRS